MEPLRRYLGWGRPWWYRAIFLVFAVGAAVALADRRGVGVGLAALVVYGGMGIEYLLWPGRVRTFSARHPLADSAFVGLTAWRRRSASV